MVSLFVRILWLICVDSRFGSPDQFVTLKTLLVWIRSSPFYPEDVGKLSNLVISFVSPFLSFVFWLVSFCLWLTRRWSGNPIDWRARRFLRRAQQRIGFNLVYKKILNPKFRSYWKNVLLLCCNSARRGVSLTLEGGTDAVLGIDLVQWRVYKISISLSCSSLAGPTNNYHLEPTVLNI